MNRIRKWIRFFFGFSGTETNGFLLFLPLLVIILLSEPVYRWATSNRPQNLDRDKIVLDSLVTMWEKTEDTVQRESESRVAELTLFPFDPNTATQTELEKLGLSKKLAARIANFRSKGGKFKIKSDLLKIYGVDSVHYHQLSRFIRLPDRIIVAEAPISNQVFTKEPIRKFDLNEADTSELKKIYGIGSRLAQRIITYRQKLGGFIALQQLNEIYGLDSLVINRLSQRAYIIESYIPSKLNINQSTDRELSSHPYISTVIAKAIVTYRFQHGKFATVEDIRNLHVLKKEEVDKIIPYLSVNP